MIQCSHCGSNISEYSIKCPNCGKNNEVNKALHNTQEVRKKQYYEKEKKQVEQKDKWHTIFCDKKNWMYLAITIIGIFVLECGKNAFNAIMGLEVAGIGAVFFMHAIQNGNMQATLIGIVQGAIVSLLGTFLLIFNIRRILKKYKQNEMLRNGVRRKV